MLPAFWLLWGVLAIGCLMPLVWTGQTIVHYLRRARRPKPLGDYSPQAVVILPVRGADPSLPRCVRGLLRQNYPKYSVRIVVDRIGDPAYDVVQAVIDECRDTTADVRIDVLRNRLETCSLKVSSQLQALAELDDDVEVVAFLDADSIPAPDWLEMMVAPLADPKVGSTAGMRWYAPPDASWGSYIRHIYNAGSAPQMHVFQIPWGGSMALRRDTIERGRLVEHWAGCFCEDTSAYGPLLELGLRNELVPTATQFNVESLEYAGASRFIFRQLLCVRLHTGLWPSLLGWNIANVVSMNAATMIAIVAALLGQWPVVAAFFALPAAYVLGQACAIAFAEVVIRRTMRTRVEHIPPYPSFWRFVPAALFTQSLSLRHMLSGLKARQVDWRGITYAIGEGCSIRLTEYRPYESNRQPAVQTRSIL